MRSGGWILLWAGLFMLPEARANEARGPLLPAKLPRIATVDERYQSYNVEMAEVIGAQDPAMPEALPPADLSRPGLRKLASALGPAYVRVSGTRASPAWFHDSDAPPPAAPPQGFQGILTRGEWKGVVEFARAVNAKIVTSFAISPGVRDEAGASAPEQARKLIAYTKSIGGQIAAAELFIPPAGGAPAGGDPAAFAREVAVFRRVARRAAPSMRIAGPGFAGEGVPSVPPSLPMLENEALLGASPRPAFDVFSYHYYGAVSPRCARMGQQMLTSPDQALSEEWLLRSDKAHDVYARLRDRFEPGKPIWVTETADAACGGNAWASSFLDSFRYLDQLGRMAKRGVKVHMHNTLASGEYGLIDAKTLAPRPNYWAALLWRRLMGTTVLDAGPSREGLHLYAHCLRGHRGGVAILAINNTRNQPESIELPVAAERYTLSARRLRESRVDLNGNQLRLQANGDLPGLHAIPTLKGVVALVPASITFLAIAGAGNRACR
jgi:heparanase